jgi:hypothetical protein
MHKSSKKQSMRVWEPNRISGKRCAAAAGRGLIPDSGPHMPGTRIAQQSTDNHNSIEEMEAMTPTNSRRLNEMEEPRGHSFVTGTATLEPGTFHEPEQPRSLYRNEAQDTLTGQAENIVSAVSETAQQTWDRVTGYVREYPLAACLIGFGLGVMVDRMFLSAQQCRRG